MVTKNSSIQISSLKFNIPRNLRANYKIIDDKTLGIWMVLKLWKYIILKTNTKSGSLNQFNFKSGFLD